MIMCRTNLDTATIQNINYLSLEIHCEVTAIFCKKFNTVVIAVYRSPLGDFKTFLCRFESILNASKQYCTEEINFTNLITSYGFISTIHEPTRKANCLDNILINFSIEEHNAYVIETNLSGHFTQIVQVHRENLGINSKQKCVTFRPITEPGCYRLFNILTDCTWEFIQSVKDDANVKFNKYLNNFIEAYNLAFTLKVFKVMV